MASLSRAAMDRRATEKKLNEQVEEQFSHMFKPLGHPGEPINDAMELDYHAAHIVAGTAFVDLNSVVLRTECNKANETMNEQDLQRLRDVMWKTYVPYMEGKMNEELNKSSGMEQYNAQMYQIHLCIRISQAMQLIFELNQKRSFSAAAKAAYSLALQDVLFHPSLRGKVSPDKYKELTYFLRRYELFSAAFNAYVGYKLLQQQLVRGGGAGSNRKSNDAARLHDEAANRLWDVLQNAGDVYNLFTNAEEKYKNEWHARHYINVAKQLQERLTEDPTAPAAAAGAAAAGPVSTPSSSRGTSPTPSGAAPFKFRGAGGDDDPLPTSPPASPSAPFKFTTTMAVAHDTSVAIPSIDLSKTIQQTRNLAAMGPVERRDAVGKTPQVKRVKFQ